MKKLIFALLLLIIGFAGAQDFSIIPYEYIYGNFKISDGYYMYVDGNGTIYVDGQVTVAGSLSVSGTVTIEDMDIEGTLTMNGNAFDSASVVSWSGGAHATALTASGGKALVLTGSDTLIVAVVEGKLNGTALAADTAAYAVQALDADTAAHAVHVFLADSASIAVLADSATAAASAHTFTGWEQIFHKLGASPIRIDTFLNASYRADTSAVTITSHYPETERPVPTFSNGMLIISPEADTLLARSKGMSLLIKY